MFKIYSDLNGTWSIYLTINSMDYFISGSYQSEGAAIDDLLTKLITLIN